MDFGNYRTDLPVLLLYNLDLSWCQEDILECLDLTNQLLNALVEVGHPVQAVCVQSAELESALEDFNPDEHLILNWCEELPGIPHSEYQVAQALERLGFTYTGTDSQALAVNQDKRQTKRLLRQWNIPTPKWQVYTSTRMIGWKRFPAIVKPAFEHCSFGITREAIVQTEADLIQRVDYVIGELQQPAIVEDFLDSREFHVGVIGNGELRVLPPAEIDYSSFIDIHDRICTYESNFDKKSLAYQLTLPKFPVFLTESQLASLEQIVIASFRATNCRDYARMDLRLQDEVFYVLDVNPNADISPDTSLVMAADLIGLSYGQFGSLLINFAAQRHNKFSIDSEIGTPKKFYRGSS
jgi:D-alanine-D-alanine ligase